MRFCRALSYHTGFQNFVVGLIVLNTIAMMFESYPMDPKLEERLDDLNVYLTIAFACEMLLKLGADGIEEYVSDAFNRFDGLVVIVSVADLIVSYLHIDLGLNASVLRAFRLLRVFRLVRSWKNLRMVLQAMMNAVGKLFDLFILLLLLIFIFSLLGMSLFGGAYTADNGWTEGEPPRTNFDSMIGSMLTVFVVISGENWNDVWSQTSSVVGQWCAPYFVVLVVLGNYVVLNLFVAILLGGFSDLEPEEAKGDGDDDSEEAARWRARAARATEACARARRPPTRRPPPACSAHPRRTCRRLRGVVAAAVAAEAGASARSLRASSRRDTTRIRAATSPTCSGRPSRPRRVGAARRGRCPAARMATASSRRSCPRRCGYRHQRTAGVGRGRPTRATRARWCRWAQPTPRLRRRLAPGLAPLAGASDLRHIGAALRAVSTVAPRLGRDRAVTLRGHRPIGSGGRPVVRLRARLPLAHQPDPPPRARHHRIPHRRHVHLLRQLHRAAHPLLVGLHGARGL